MTLSTEIVLFFVLASIGLIYYVYQGRRVVGAGIPPADKSTSLPVNKSHSLSNGKIPSQTNFCPTQQGSEIDNGEDKSRLYKELYYKLQNLEDFPEVLPRARQTLVSFLYEGLLIERSRRPRARSILAMEDYSRAALEKFLAAEHEDTLDQWEQYNQRRASGHGPELFSDRQGAIKWLKQLTPLKYVDGAWLGHIHKVTTPFALRGVTKDAWQILSEELGDGDLEKNHVFVYKTLLQDVGIALPDGDSADFIQARHGMDDEQVWKAATAQLLISLFPNEFLPEILGFNMHYELLTLGTLKASKELPEFNISGYYFVLHVSIDNADSGHTAMALATVTQYIDLIQKTGSMDVQEAWRRIQAGYVLSKVLGDSESLQKSEARVVDILRLKANVSHRIHCTSRARIGQRSLADWLSPNSWAASKDWKQDFLNSLADATPWVYRGNSSKSLLMRELSWQGKMFGAFTHAEVEDVRKWIDSLEAKDTDFQKRYWQTVGRHCYQDTLFPLSNQDVAVDHPTFPPQQKPPLIRKPEHGFTPRLPLQAFNVRLDNLLPMWFVHPCLLENMVNTPHKTATRLASHIVRLLRAESGFIPETSGVAGMDEHLHPGYHPSLVTLGLEMVQRQQRPPPTCLKDVLVVKEEEEEEEEEEAASHAVTFAYAMLSWAMQPAQNGAFLLGLARAFLDLEAWVAGIDEFLAEKEREALRRLVKRKEDCFEELLEELKTDVYRYGEFVGGYELGRTEIDKALQ